MVVVFGLFPGMLLDIIEGPTKAALESVAGAAPIALDPIVPAIGLGLVVAVVVVRLFAIRPGRPSGEDAAAQPAEGAA
jgi:hypothetical protein